MKKIFSPFTAIVLIAFLSCNSVDKKTEPVDRQQAIADSLQKEVDDAHMVGMRKTGSLKSMKFRAEQLLDSIAKLPAKAKDAAAPLKARLDELVLDLNDAREGMDKWMREFDMDSAVNNLEMRIKYLADEKLKVGKVKDAILQSLARADSLINSKQ